MGNAGTRDREERFRTGYGELDTDRQAHVSEKLHKSEPNRLVSWRSQRKGIRRMGQEGVTFIFLISLQRNEKLISRLPIAYRGLR